MNIPALRKLDAMLLVRENPAFQIWNLTSRQANFSQGIILFAYTCRVTLKI